MLDFFGSSFSSFTCYTSYRILSKESMFTRAKIYNGGTYLKNHLRANDYYSKGERVSGEWVGIGAEKLGLRGEVTPEQF